MIEIVLGAVRHADPGHHAARFPVPDGRERQDLLEVELLEAEAQRGERALGRIAAPPECRGQPPPDFN